MVWTWSSPCESYTYASVGYSRSRSGALIRSLVITSYAFNYGAILLDLPVGESA
jgi:hypothetical protein